MRRQACLPVAVLTVALAAGCGHNPWPDEPGVPVDLVRADNVEAAEQFLTTLTARRRATNLAAPIVTPRYQSELQKFAEELQAGKLSAGEAQQAMNRWVRAAHGSEVKTFTLDCSAGADMPLPSALVGEPFVVISYAAAHFRPRSLARNQCAILATALSQSEDVAPTSL